MNEKKITILEEKKDRKEEKDNYEPVAWVAIENSEKIDGSKRLKR
ncbi:MAG: hypothetical protein OIN89_03785 [Candidatus Methanoperedens sp.]|jgi:hypothetical protein|nr:hypothetical protein [Candidatus Methanoperedens sp.]